MSLYRLFYSILYSILNKQDHPVINRSNTFSQTPESTTTIETMKTKPEHRLSLSCHTLWTEPVWTEPVFWLKALLVTFSDKFWREVESRMWGRLRNQICGASWGTLHKLSLFVFKYFFFYDFYDDFQCHYWILHFYCPEIICQLQTTKVGLWSSLGHVMRFWAIEINLTWLYVLRKWGILMKTRTCKWTNKTTVLLYMLI